MHTLDPDVIKKVLATALARGGDFADVFYEHSATTMVSLSERKVKAISGGITEGVGIRVLHGERSGYAYTDDLSEHHLVQAAEAASYVAQGSHTPSSAPFTRRRMDQIHDIARHCSQVDVAKKVDLVLRADDAARSLDPKVIEVSSGYGDHHRRIIIANSEGEWVESEDELMRLSVSVLASDSQRRDSGMSFRGGRYGFEHFDRNTPEDAAREATRQALLKLTAKPAPAGVYPVLLDPGWGGVLVHEGVGHGLEGDFNRKGSSIYAGKLGTRVCSPLVTIIDDGTVPHARGSLAVDDEGIPMQKTMLIEKGILTGFLYDRLNARLMETTSTGSGRRESFHHVPLPRMRNTYIDAGHDAPEDLLASVAKGVYAKSLGGGQVDIVSGNFVFEINEGYLIENGKLGTPLRGANLIGNGPDAMNKVTGVGNDLQIDTRTGSCGKDGQYVPVGVGQPTILISEMTIGGTEY